MKFEGKKAEVRLHARTLNFEIPFVRLPCWCSNRGRQANTYKIARNRYINLFNYAVEQVWCFILKYQQIGVIK
jgi:outer membrane biogenesis lipoprotein LolB